ncbi:alpha/beta hydrolase [Metasolibacillus sp. FSL K6-0083]|uniref:alpha/beta fold hydrolase n=1 Tax=Metasolibacillus sp. FSL K6-0083 TaxID=2921416 RepID=UPI000797059D|nr:alpha/beta hydrolase [[Bacillus] sp. KCTC 13219]
MDLQHQTFHNKGCDIHYWHKSSSSADYVIFLHGAGCDHRMFASQLPIFGESYNVLLWDARGHGLSKLQHNQTFSFEDMIDDFLKLCEKYQIANAILIGQSMGGNLAQEILFRKPNLVSKLILIDCTRNTGKLTLSEKLMLKLSKPIFYCYPWQTLIRQSAEACGNDEAVKAYVRNCLAQMKKKDFIDVMMSLMTCLREDEAYRFPKPVLLLCGEDDRSGNIRKIVAPWADSDANCTLLMIEKAGHNANQDNPTAVNKAIASFLTTP